MDVVGFPFWPSFCAIYSLFTYLFILGPNGQRVLCQIYFGTVFMVDFGVYVVLLTSTERDEARDIVPLAVSARASFRLLSVRITLVQMIPGHVCARLRDFHLEQSNIWDIEWYHRPTWWCWGNWVAPSGWSPSLRVHSYAWASPGALHDCP